MAIKFTKELREVPKKSGCYLMYNIEKSHADKEPNGTTRGLIDIIHRKELNRVLIVVIRYFGGTLLGSGLLTRTYTKVVSMLFIE